MAIMACESGGDCRCIACKRGGEQYFAARHIRRFYPKRVCRQFCNNEQNYQTFAKYSVASPHFSCGYAGVQNEVLEHRRGRSGAYGRIDERRHDKVSRRKSRQFASHYSYADNGDSWRCGVGGHSRVVQSKMEHQRNALYVDDELYCHRAYIHLHCSDSIPRTSNLKVHIAIVIF